MTIIRVGATKRYSDGWEKAFAGKKTKKQGNKPQAAAAPKKKTKKGKKRG